MSAGWRLLAACADEDPEIFDTDHNRIAEAQAICRECPVTVQCRQFATKHRVNSGVWAGESWKSKESGEGMSDYLREHGTEGGNARHRRLGEEPCAACRLAANLADEARRHQRNGVLV